MTAVASFQRRVLSGRPLERAKLSPTVAMARYERLKAKASEAAIQAVKDTLSGRLGLEGVDLVTYFAPIVPMLDKAISAAVQTVHGTPEAKAEPRDKAPKGATNASARKP